MRPGSPFIKKLLTSVLVAMLGVAVACGSISTSTPKPAAQTPTVKTTTPIDSSPSKAVTINLSAQNMSFDKNTITVPAGAKVMVVFNNKEGIPHNLAVYETKSATKVIFQGQVITGPATIEYNFTAPDAPGTYFFRCDLHPSTMTGSFVVTG